MKNIKYTFVFIAFIFSAQSFAQGAYEKGMQKGLSLWGENKTVEAVAMFERIAQVEKDNWLPLYYASNILIIQSFSDSTTDIKNERLKKATQLIEKAHGLSPDNSELLTLEGMLYTGYVAMDPATYGMQYSGKIMDLHARAIELDPSNPRAHMNSIEYELGAAQFFKTDTAPICEKMKSVLVKFDEQSTDLPFAPKGGKERALQVIENCGL